MSNLDELPMPNDMKYGIGMKYLTEIDQLEWLSEAEKAALKSVTEKFDFRCNEYYLSLI